MKPDTIPGLENFTALLAENENIPDVTPGEGTGKGQGNPPMGPPVDPGNQGGGGETNLAPEVSDGQTFSIDENTGTFTTSNVVVASDPDAGDSLTCAIVGGNEAGIFAIDPATGALSVVDPSQLDFESGVTSYTLTIDVTDDGDPPLTSTTTVTINVNDVNEVPTDIALDNAAVAENAAGAVVGNLSVADPDAGDSHSFTVSDARFEVVGGQLKLLDGVSLDFEIESFVTVEVTATDSGGLSLTESFTLTVGDANDQPVADPRLSTTDEDAGVFSFDLNNLTSDQDGGDVLSITGVTQVVGPNGRDLGGAFSVTNGVISFDTDLFNDLTEGESETIVFEYTVDDGSGAANSSATSTFTVIVEGRDDAADGGGGATPVPAVFSAADLDGTNGFRIDGEAGGDSSGHRVSSAGDVNGDGYDDMLVSSMSADPDGVSNAGATYVVFGQADGWTADFDLATIDGTNGFRVDGVTTNSFSGYSVSAAGDVNGDGFADFIIGATTDNGGTGAAYVVFGQADWSATPSIDVSALDGSNGFRIDGVTFGDSTGISVSSAGDINGDGYDDLIVGAAGADNNANTSSGSTYVVFGQADGSWAADLDAATLDGTNGFRLDGGAAGDLSGSWVSSAGDLNGDGFDDIVVGAEGADPNGYSSAGSVYVVFGKDGGWDPTIDLSTLNGIDGFRVDGTSFGESLGNAVSSAGDVNGDGFDDLIVGGYGYNSNTGATYVIFGQAGGWGATFDLASLDGNNGFRLDGASAYEMSGYSVSSAGDVNGDGFDDLLIGARYASNTGPYSYSGSSYVVFGKAGGWTASVDLGTLDGTDGFRIDGVTDFELSGASVSSAGDVNGDGFDDIMVGAYLASADGSYAGSTYIIFGGDFTGAVSQFGTSGVDILVGSGAADGLFGAQGDDILVGGGGADVLSGGEGDDLIEVSDLSFQQIDGGSGSDTLSLTGAGLDLDLASIDGSNVEAIDLTGSGDNSLTMSVTDLLQLSDSSNTLTVSGDAGDQINIGAEWVNSGTTSVDGVLYDVYTVDGVNATLNLDTDLTVQVV